MLDRTIKIVEGITGYRNLIAETELNNLGMESLDNWHLKLRKLIAV